jgi:hypothetical protein
VRLAREQVTHPKDPAVETPTEPDAPEVPFREELLVECLSSFPFVRLSVSGRCMQPALDDSEKVHLVHPSHRRPRLGDVVLARGRDGLRLHRLVWGPPLAPSGTHGRWRMKADRGRLLDPPLDPSDVLGVVVFAEGHASQSVRRPVKALGSLAAGVLARLWMGSRAARVEATP